MGSMAQNTWGGIMSDGMKDMIMFVAWSTIIIEVACIGFMLANYFRLDTVL